MTVVDFVALVMVPITVLATATGVMVGVGLGTKKNRLATISVLQAHTFGAPRLEQFSQLWSSYFETLFGKEILARRQLITVPLFTLLVSAGFFLTWVLYVYIFKSQTSSLFVSLPPTMRQAAHDFYTKGVIATIALVFCAIQLTKLSVRGGKKSGFCSSWFYILAAFSIVVIYFLFSIVVHFFRVEDMVWLYAELAPTDPLPVMPYAPFSNMASSLSLFHPPTTIHVTSQGWYATYFMPEPLIFYCAATAQASLLGIAVSYQVAAALEKIKLASIGFLNLVGTPEANAASVVIFIVIGLLAIPVIILSIGAILTGG
ncbi:hypothetical protein [Vreelandella titanicae]|uniref:hypothetical protein n=1 Tax=Vreelandella titanicae TaxID=664683 RepID=UPI0037FD99DA